MISKVVVVLPPPTPLWGFLRRRRRDFFCFAKAARRSHSGGLWIAGGVSGLPILLLPAFCLGFLVHIHICVGGLCSQIASTILEDLLRSVDLKTSGVPPYRCWFVLVLSDCYARRSFILVDFFKELVRGSGFRVCVRLIRQCEP
ncbi:transmembrane protein, putative [Medicago truncatula]|uniref:Transmembrane protein, putative n=1 Tax=Medicago truncatula TaxID=3880 RepID=G7JC56_MEDTR|nr:transmembrane protein, putative [Medicago truncatula]